MKSNQISKNNNQVTAKEGKRFKQVLSIIGIYSESGQFYSVGQTSLTMVFLVKLGEKTLELSQVIGCNVLYIYS